MSPYRKSGDDEIRYEPDPDPEPFPAIEKVALIVSGIVFTYTRCVGGWMCKASAPPFICKLRREPEIAAFGHSKEEARSTLFAHLVTQLRNGNIVATSEPTIQQVFLLGKALEQLEWTP